MFKIVIGTTPTITCTFSTVPVQDITTAFLTVRDDSAIIIEKTLAEATVLDKALAWDLSQEETLSLKNKSLTIMVNWKTAGGKRGVSRTASAIGTPNHKEEVI